MLVLNLFDDNFSNQICSVATKTPKTCSYIRYQRDWDGVTLFTDSWLFKPEVDQVMSRYKIGWLHEGLELHPENYQRVHDVKHKFNAILTTEPELYNNDHKFWPCIRGGSWVSEDQWGIYPKTRKVSMILSDKFTLPGHKLRHTVASEFTDIDLYGGAGIRFGVDKRIPYRDYQFAIVIEGSRREGWFSEHLLDCIAFGTIPLYWGDPKINRFLDGRGMLPWQSEADLRYILKHLPPDMYGLMVRYAYDNLTRLKDYAITEDWFVKNVLVPKLGLTL